MALDLVSFDNITEREINLLVTDGVPEGLYIEYKRDMYDEKNNKDSNKEAMKDISSFANAYGGYLLIGVDEAGGVPVAVPGVPGVDPDKVIQRLENLARDGIQPRVQGLRIRAVPLTNGAHCFVIRVPRSWNLPHRVISGGVNRFWVKNSSGVHEASVEELRTMFTQNLNALDSAHRFRDVRIAEIASGAGSRPIVGAGRLILHIIPLASLSGTFSISLNDVWRKSPEFRPIGSSSGHVRFNFEGVINERLGNQNQCHGYTQIFRNGIVEATKSSIVRDRAGRKFIHGLTIERDLFGVIDQYIGALQSLNVPAPLLALISFEEVHGAYYEVRKNEFEDLGHSFHAPVLNLPDCVINEYSSTEDHHQSFKPAIDALWNSAGRAEAASLPLSQSWRDVRQG